MNDDLVRISKSELESIVLAASRVTVQECQTSFMATLGINIANADEIRKFQATLRFAEAMHMGSTKVGARLAMTFISVMAGAIAIAMWEWLKALVHGVHP